MHIVGFTAANVSNAIYVPPVEPPPPPPPEDPTVSWDANTIKSVTTKAQFRNLVKETFGSIVTDNIDAATFNHNGIGLCFRIGNSSFMDGTPIFEAKTKKPKTITIAYSYYHSASIMARFILRFSTLNKKSYTDAFDVHDAHYNYPGTDFIWYDNHTKKLATIVKGDNQGSVNLNVATQLPNCFTDGGSEYILGWYNALKYSGYNTGPFYINSFTMTF